MSVSLKRNNLSVFIRYLFLLCFCLPLLTSCESNKIIVNALDEREANEILVFLSTKGVDASKVPNPTSKTVMWDISVNSVQAVEAMSYLNQAGLPRRRSQNLLNIFTGTGLVPSEMEQKIRYQAGLAEQIASTIRKMDGILDAEVQISFPEEDPLNPTQKKQPITASVFVKHNGILEDPNSHLVTKIKRLVAAGVPGLDYDNVTVVGERARYNELPIDVGSAANEEAKQYVNVWGLTIAKDSLTRFRIVFFALTLLVLLLGVMLIWLLWKIYPILKHHGGLSALLHLKPLPVGTHEEKKAEEKSVEAPKEAKSAQENLADKDVDQT